MRTVICDQDGYVLAESVYRCLKCPAVLSSVSSAQRHYYACHMTDDQDNEIEDPFFGADNWSDGQDDGRVASSALTDTHPNVVKALTAPFSPVAESSSSRQSLAVVPNGEFIRIERNFDSNCLTDCMIRDSGKRQRQKAAHKVRQTETSSVSETGVHNVRLHVQVGGQSVRTHDLSGLLPILSNMVQESGPVLVPNTRRLQSQRPGSVQSLLDQKRDRTLRNE